jgi:hypothetical protein
LQDIVEVWRMTFIPLFPDIQFHKNGLA